MILLSILLAALSAAFVTAILRPPNRPAVLLAGWLIGFTHIILAMLVAGALRLMDRPGLVLLIQAVLSTVSGLVWARDGRPRLPGNWRGLLAELRGWNLAAILKKRTWLILLAGGAAAVYAAGAGLILLVPPNNNDSMSTHLSRIGYWLQQGSYLPWPIFNTKTVFYPLNAAFQVYWTVLFHGTDQLAGFVQWSAALASVLTVFGIARLLGWGRAQSAYAGLIWASFPIVLLQSTTTQLDLIAAAVFLPVVYFLILALRSGRTTMLWMSALSLALAMGTKQTLLFLLPGLGIFVLLQWREWRRKPRWLLTWIGATAVLFGLVSSPIYLINWTTYGSPLGPPEVVQSSTGSHSADDALDSLLYGTPRLAYQMIDFSGLPRQAERLGILAKARAAQSLFDSIHLDLEAGVALAPGHHFVYEHRTLMNEDEAWFGPLGFLLLVPAAVWQFAVGLRRKDPLRIGLVFLALSYLPVNAILRPGWDPFQGRYFIAAAACAAPLMAALFTDNWAGRIVRWAALPVALLAMAVVTVYNPAKPLRSSNINIFTAPRMEKQAQQSRYLLPYMSMVAENVPEDAALGFYCERYLWDYPLFGEHFTRRVQPIVSLDNLGDAAWLKEQGLEYVLVNTYYTPDAPQPGGLDLLAELEGEWRLYGRADGP